jgi:short-subunit dehydrogenase
MRIKHQVAVVTGASSGIGAELARQLGAAGVKVGLTARRVDQLEAVAGEIRRGGGTSAVAAADAEDAGSTRLVIARLAEALGSVDLLVANAGLGLKTPANRFSTEDLGRIMRVNVLGAAAAIEAVLPGMLERGSGHIVGISSLAGYRGLPRTSGYSASKAALSTLLEGLRIELAAQGIAVTVVHPGYVRTPMIEGSPHPPPFVMGVDRAARIILKGIAAGRREINFPWQIASLMGLLRALPGPFYDRLMRSLLLRSASRSVKDRETD